jgi:formylglycine-generating enzyme required for sulfatase activity
MPNDYGLYDVAGNVSEWVEDAYDENSYEFTHDLVPIYKHNAKESDHPSMKRKVVRGGSWKDISYFVQCGSRSYEYQDTTKSYIGFRTIRSILGTHNE